MVNVIDPRAEAVFVVDKNATRLDDKTDQVVQYRVEEVRTILTMKIANGFRDYSYPSQRVVIFTDPVPIPMSTTDQVEVQGEVWSSSVTDVLEFGPPGSTWRRIFYQMKEGQQSRIYPSAEVRILHDAGDPLQAPRSATTLKYFRAVVDALKPSDPTRKAFEQLKFVHPQSALARYLSGDPIGVNDLDVPGIVPFSSNLSQQSALEMAVRHSISVIEGPPGTGKTQTILNIIANLVGTPGTTVGVVSSNNAAVDNVREKLDRDGYGFMAAGLGNRGRKTPSSIQIGNKNGTQKSTTSCRLSRAPRLQRKSLRR